MADLHGTLFYGVIWVVNRIFTCSTRYANNAEANFYRRTQNINLVYQILFSDVRESVAWIMNFSSLNVLMLRKICNALWKNEGIFDPYITVDSLWN